MLEFGGIAYSSQKKPQADKAWGYELSWNISELQMKYTTLLNVIISWKYSADFVTHSLPIPSRKPTAFCMPIARLIARGVASATLGRGEEEESEAILQHLLKRMVARGRCIPRIC